MSKLKFSAVLLLLFSFISVSVIFYRHTSKTVKGAKIESAPTFVAAVLPHHLLAENLIDDFISRLTYTPQKIYVIGPNHPEVGQASVITNNNPDSNTLLNTGFVRIDEDIVSREHSVRVYQDKFASKFPKTIVVPLVVSANITMNQIDKLSRYLASNSPKNTLIICSTDFSHYLSLSDAQSRDSDTLELISKRNYLKIYTLTNSNIDSSKSLLIFLKTLDLTHHNQMQVLSHTNSANILNQPTLPSTTSYFELAFY